MQIATRFCTVSIKSFRAFCRSLLHKSSYFSTKVIIFQSKNLINHHILVQKSSFFDRKTSFSGPFCSQPPFFADCDGPAPISILFSSFFNRKSSFPLKFIILQQENQDFLRLLTSFGLYLSRSEKSFWVTKLRHSL